MGVDLTLIPIDGQDSDNPHGYTILQLERRRILWETIEKLPKYDLPARFHTHDAYTRGREALHDGYGNLLQCVTAGALASLRDNYEVTDNDKNQAVWAYLMKLKLINLVVLYWH